jgi:hypothetical protein
MIGILFLFVIGLWIVISITLGIKIPLWLGLKRDRQVLMLAPVFALLVFVAPVADEIIAYPQMMALCSNLPPLGLAEGMDEKKAYGRAVYYQDISTPIQVFPSSVHIDRHDAVYFDAKSHEKILSYHGYTPKKAFLAVSNGSSGGTMTLILQSCSGMKADANGYALEKYDANGLPVRFSHLKLTKFSPP